MPKEIEIRKDIVGNIPQIGDLVAFNPPAYKGIIYGTVTGYTTVGLPILGNLRDDNGRVGHYGTSWTGNDEQYKKEFYAPKTGFAVIKINMPSGEEWTKIMSCPELT